MNFKLIMAIEKPDQAFDHTEEALEKLADGNDKAANNLIEEAKKLDLTGP